MPTIEDAKKWYEGSDAVHDFEHVKRVYFLAEKIGVKEGADLEIVQAAALLHDSKGSDSGKDCRRGHHLTSALFAGEVLKKEGWPEERIEAVQHCIRAHRFRDDSENPQSIEAMVLFDSDKLDVLGAIGIARTVGYSVLANEPIYVEPSQKFLETGEKEEGEPHSAYHEHLFKLVKIKDLLYTKTAREIAAERSEYINGFFVRLAAEMRGEK